MKRNILIVTGIALAFLSGCVVSSVYPYYSEKDVVFEPALIGNWGKTNQSRELWKFERDKANGYRVTVDSDGKQTLEHGQFFKLQGQMFLDLCAKEWKDDIQPEPVPSHMLLRVEQLKPTLKMTALDYDWLKKLLAENPQAIRHLMIPVDETSSDGRIVLTADTAELQQFVLKHLKTAEAWSEAIELQPMGAESTTR